MKTNRTQIHFLSEAFAVIAVLRDRRFESKYAYRITLLIKLKKQYNTRTISNGWIRIYTTNDDDDDDDDDDNK